MNHDDVMSDGKLRPTCEGGQASPGREETEGRSEAGEGEGLDDEGSLARHPEPRAQTEP